MVSVKNGDDISIASSTVYQSLGESDAWSKRVNKKWIIAGRSHNLREWNEGFVKRREKVGISAV